MTTLIAIPYYGVAADLVENAVRHALAQDADVVVLVAGDGQAPPVRMRHDRLVLGTFERNRGAPMTQQAMLLGSPFSHYAPHGADDWLEPYHVSSLLALRRPAAGSSCVWVHDGGVRRLLRSPRTWIEFGVFESELLRELGGYNAAEPCGQDSVLISVLLQTSGVRLSTRPSYHKLIRADSLTHDPATRQGSPLRVGVKERNAAVLRHLGAIGWHDRAAIRRYRESLLPADLALELDLRAAAVARWLS